MDIIGIEKYRVYCEYGGDYSQMTDFRVGSKKDMAKITSEEWDVIYKIDHNYSTLQTGMYSKEMVGEMEKTIEDLQPFVSPEVFRMIKANEKPEPLKSNSWLGKIFGKK